MGIETKKKVINVQDMDAYARMLSLADVLQEPAIRSAIRALKLPSGSQGMDVGCGIGRHTLWLAEAVVPGGHVTDLDLSPEFLTHAREEANKSRMSKHVSFQEGDVNKLPFDDNTFDWVWSADTIWIGPKTTGCPAEDPLPLVKELTRVVKPEFHFLCTRGWLRDACLEDLAGYTFVTDVQVPLSNDIRSALTATFQIFWAKSQSEVTVEDWVESMPFLLIHYSVVRSSKINKRPGRDLNPSPSLDRAQ